jgi:hypothetical protein
MISIPRDIKKQDLYDHIDQLSSIKKTEVTKKYEELLKPLVEKARALLVPKAKAYDENAQRFFAGQDKLKDEEFVFDHMLSKLREYSNVSQFAYKRKNSKAEVAITQHVERTYGMPKTMMKTIEKHYPQSIKDLYQEYNDICKGFDGDIKAINKLHGELTRIVRVAPRGSNAWKDLVQIGFDLKPLETKLRLGGSSGNLPAALQIQSDVNLFNDIKLSKEDVQ